MVFGDTCRWLNEEEARETTVVAVLFRDWHFCGVVEEKEEKEDNFEDEDEDENEGRTSEEWLVKS